MPRGPTFPASDLPALSCSLMCFGASVCVYVYIYIHIHIYIYTYIITQIFEFRCLKLLVWWFVIIKIG